jgi:hypothetical protein
MHLGGVLDKVVKNAPRQPAFDGKTPGPLAISRPSFQVLIDKADETPLYR